MLHCKRDRAGRAIFSLLARAEISPVRGDHVRTITGRARSMFVLAVSTTERRRERLSTFDNRRIYRSICRRAGLAWVPRSNSPGILGSRHDFSRCRETGNSLHVSRFHERQFLFTYRVALLGDTFRQIPQPSHVFRVTGRDTEQKPGATIRALFTLFTGMLRDVCCARIGEDTDGARDFLDQQITHRQFQLVTSAEEQRRSRGSFITTTIRPHNRLLLEGAQLWTRVRGYHAHRVVHGRHETLEDTSH